LWAKAVVLLMFGGSMSARAALAQGPVLRIGIIAGGRFDQRGHMERALVDALRDSGYAEGRNLVIVSRYADGKYEAIPSLARDLAARQLDLVIATCTPTTRAMQAATGTTPIVMAMVADPVGQGFVESLRRPGRNITGTSTQFEDVLPKMLEFLARVVSRSAAVATLVNVQNPVHVRLWEKAVEAAGRIGVRLARHEVESLPGLASALERLAAVRAGGLFVLPDDPTFFNARRDIAATALKLRLPAMGWASEFVDAGLLMSYGESTTDAYRRTARFVERIAKGALPGELPVEQPLSFELAVNRGTAAGLGLKMPDDLMIQAVKVVG